MSLGDLLRGAPGAELSHVDTNLFEEEPVPLTVFVSDRSYLGNPSLSETQYEAVRHIERVYFPATYGLLAGSSDRRVREYWTEPCPMKNIFTLQWGKGSGKDHICRLSSLRIAYLLICLRSPLQYYGMPEQDTIHMLNVASSSGQAQRAYFTPMTRAVTRGWFEGRCQPLQNVIRFDKNLEAISGHSDAESQEGLNLILGIADEIDAFRSQEELERYRGAQARESTRSAEGILKMIRSSSVTRFPEVFKNVRISYPRYLGSKIQVLSKQGRESIEKYGDNESPHYVSGPLPTWAVNPRVHGKAAFQDEYDDDPVMAAAKYECAPSYAINPYFSNEMALEACEVAGEQPLEVDYERGDGGVAWRPLYTFSNDLYPVRGAQYAIHADLAVRGDRAGVALAHVVRYDPSSVIGHDEDGAEVQLSEHRPFVKVDFVISYSADLALTPPREIQIRWYRMLVLELRRRGFNIRRATCDGYQSTDNLQILETYGIETERESTDLSDDGWKNARDLLSERRMVMVRRERLHMEILALSRKQNGKVDHLPGGSKDEADAWALAVLGAVKLGGQEEETGERAYAGESEFLVGDPLPTPEGFTFFRQVGYADPEASRIDLSDEAAYARAIDEVFGAER